MYAEEVLGRRRKPHLAIACCSVAAIAGAYGFHRKRLAIEESANYQLSFSQPEGWKSRPLTPGMMFIYENNTSHLSMRGAVNNVVSETNPTPDLDAEALIRHYQKITVENLKGWHYRLLDSVEAHGAQFRLIRRWTTDRCVVSAIAVRGNTTVIIALVGEHANAPLIDEGIPAFRTYLANLSLVPAKFADEMD